MSWIFVNDLSATTGDFWAMDNDHPISVTAAIDRELLVRGTFLAEFDLSAAGRVPARLVHFEDKREWDHRFTVFLNADHSVAVEVQQGSARSYARLPSHTGSLNGKVRLTYSWDAPNRNGLLTIEDLDTGAVQQVVVDTPVPMPVCDARTIAGGSNGVIHDARLQSVAISSTGHCVGPRPSIAAGTFVETEFGPRPIDRLQLGDRVLTASNGMQPIRWIVKERLPSAGQLAPLILRAPYLGLERDVTVSHCQKVMINRAEAEYLFGEESVLIRASQLTSRPIAAAPRPTPTQMYYQLLLDAPNCISLSGAWAESLFIGNLVSAPMLRATTHLAGLPDSGVPRHLKSDRPILRKFESYALLDAISA